MSSSRLEIRGLLSLPGKVGSVAVAVTSGAVVAGDDRGEAGIWEADGTRRATFRLRGRVTWADADPAGRRAAFVADGGEALVTSPGAASVRSRVRSGEIVLLDRAGTGFFAIDPATGRVAVHDREGRPLRRFDVPHPVAGVVSVARTGGLVTMSRHGVLARTAPWGELAWGGDYQLYAGGVAADLQGERVWVCLLSRGVEILHASSGARTGALDLGRPAACVAASTGLAVVGCTDGAVLLLDRQGAVVAEGRVPSKPVEVAIADSGAVFVRSEDGLVRVLDRAGAAAASGARLGATQPVAGLRRPLWRPGGLRPPVHVVVAPDGSRVAVSAGSRVEVLAPDGTPAAAATCDGTVLALRLRPTGDAVAVTTREIRAVGDGGFHCVRRFPTGLTLAAWSDDGATVALADDLGTVRIVDRASWADVGSTSLPLGEVVTRLAATPVGAALETRSGAVRAFGADWERDLAPADAKGPLRLGAATADGVFVVAGDELWALAWDGSVRWRHRFRSPPQAVQALPGGSVAVVWSDGMQSFRRDGSPTPARPRPEGAFCGSVAGATAVVGWRDGRRLLLTGPDAAARFDETFESVVLAAAASEDLGSVAVVLDGAVAVVRPRAAADAALPAPAPTAG